MKEASSHLKAGLRELSAMECKCKEEVQLVQAALLPSLILFSNHAAVGISQNCIKSELYRG